MALIDDGAADFDSFFAAAESDAKSAAEKDLERISRSYFANDCQWIVQHVQESPDRIPGVVALVLLSIRQPFYLIPNQVEDVRRRGADSPWLFGWKWKGFVHSQLFKREIWTQARACYEGKKSLDDLLLDYLAIPGLGIVKASFLAQMTVGRGACLDTLNLRTLGLDETAFRTRKSLKVESIRRRIETYNATWQRQGDSCYWWDSWCDMVASRTHNSRGHIIRGFDSGAAVSAQHRLAITGGIK